MVVLESESNLSAPLSFIGTIFHELSHARQVHYGLSIPYIIEENTIEIGLEETELVNYFSNIRKLPDDNSRWSDDPKELASEIASEIATDRIIYSDPNFIIEKLKSISYGYTDKMGNNFMSRDVLVNYDKLEGLDARFYDNFDELVKYNYGVDGQANQDFLRNDGIKFPNKNSSIGK